VTTQTLHPYAPAVELVELIQSGVREVTGIESLIDIRTIQACADAAEVPVTWRISRHGGEATLVDVPTGGAG
jgi:hypothetical protein